MSEFLGSVALASAHSKLECKQTTVIGSSTTEKISFKMPRPPPPFMKFRGQKKKYSYIPPPSSGAYAILVGMFKAEQNEFIKNLTKQQVLDYSTRHSTMGLRDNSKIWASMKGLIDKSLVDRQISRDPLYFLTDEGRDLAQKLIALAEDPEASSSNTAMDLAPSQSEDSNTASNQAFYHTNESDATFELKAGTFDIKLIVDQREKIELINPDGNLKMETRTLACGDFIWVARPKNIIHHDRTHDLVLDYVIERKRLDDLASSIFDGRFEQQKLRLINSGLRRPVYLIEDIGALRHGAITSSGLAQAVVNILTHDGIDVEKVKNLAHANDYLIGMTKCITKLYSNMDLKSASQERLKSGEAAKNEFMTFSEFQTKGAKITNWTVREMFAKHLIQITGMSDRRVAVIINKYPTVSALIKAYSECNSDKERENLLAKLQIPESNRTIGPAISKRVFVTYAMPPELDDDEDILAIE